MSDGGKYDVINVQRLMLRLRPKPDVCLTNDPREHGSPASDLDLERLMFHDETS